MLFWESCRGLRGVGETSRSSLAKAQSKIQTGFRAGRDSCAFPDLNKAHSSQNMLQERSPSARRTQHARAHSMPSHVHRSLVLKQRCMLQRGPISLQYPCPRSTTTTTRHPCLFRSSSSSSKYSTSRLQSPRVRDILGLALVMNGTNAPLLEASPHSRRSASRIARILNPT